MQFWARGRTSEMETPACERRRPAAASVVAPSTSSIPSTDFAVSSNTPTLPLAALVVAITAVAPTMTPGVKGQPRATQPGLGVSIAIVAPVSAQEGRRFSLGRSAAARGERVWRGSSELHETSRDLMRHYFNSGGLPYGILDDCDAVRQTSRM